MQDIIKSRVELRDRQTQTQGYVSRFEPFSLRSRLHSVKDFHYLHKRTPQRIQTPIFYTRGGTKLMHKANFLYTKGGHKANTHKRRTQAKAQSQKEKLEHLVIIKIINKKSHNIRS